ncbi:T9SS type A sorting domain-containing protein [Algibacter sp.]|uniref:T9SS type A sorting domain-containing protein n=1 Tax=Algibacter sp. TaxID=1872428 RepID=UPI003C78FBCD
MNNKITFIIAFLIISSLKAQTTFDWDTPTPTDNGDNVSQTVDGFTATFTISGFNSVGVANGAALDGSSGNVVSSSVDSSEPSTPSTNLVFSFSEAVDITSIITVVGPSNTLTFTPTGGSNSVVTETAFSGGVVNLNWTGVTSFVVTGSNTQFVIAFDDLIVSSSTLSTKNNVLENISIFPNPVTDFLNIGHVKNLKSIRIYNSLGQLVKETNQEKIDLRDVNRGVYLIQINTGENILNKRIIKR